MKIFKTIVLISVFALLISGIFFLYNRLTGSFIEKSAPEILSLQMPRGIGLLPVQASWAVKDRGAGLREISIKLKSRNKTKEVFKRSFSGESSAEIHLELSKDKFPELLNGQVELIVNAFDRSYFSNSSEMTFPLLVDFKKPSLSPLTLQHNVYKGNIELAMWKAKDENLHVSGVKDGNLLFQGFPAKSVDTTFKGNDTFIGFFLADPFSELSNPKIILSAEDLAGNSTTSNFTYKILDRKYPPIKVKAGEALATRIASLVESGKSRIDAWKSTSGEEKSELSLFDEFKILEKLDRLDLQGITSSASSGKLWHGPFYPLLGTVLNTYGSKTTYQKADGVFGERLSLGYEMRTKNQQTIFAPNSGKIIYAGDFGVFGNTVIIDHGLGICSLHGFLNTISVNKGDQVKNGAAIGIAGETGFAIENGYYLEFSLRGVPFDPRGFWDQKWYEEHINKKIISVKKGLGLPIFSNGY